MSSSEEDLEENVVTRDLAADASWKIIQKNTFTRWTNEHLKTANRLINDLESDLSDGLLLIVLVEVLSGKKFKFVHRRPNFRTQKLENVTMALEFLENDEGIRIVNIDSAAIIDGELKLILGLIWTLILHYSISMPIWEGDEQQVQEEGQTPKQRLLNWVQNKIPDLSVKNFTTDWYDGKAIGALVDAIAPGLCPDWEDWDPKKADQNVKTAMDAAEEWLNVPQLIKPDEITNPNVGVDELSMMTYLSQFPMAKLKPGVHIKPRTEPNQSNKMETEHPVDQIQVLSSANPTSELTEQTSELKEQTSYLEEQTPELNEQKSELNEQSSELKEQTSELQEQTSELKEKTSELEKQTSELNEQKSEQKEQTSELNKQTSELQEHTSELNEQTSELNEQTSELTEQTPELMEQTSERMEQTSELMEQTPPAPTQKANDVDDNRERVENIFLGEEGERDKRLYNLFKSENDVQGRLKELDEQNVTDLMDFCGTSRHGFGGFGDIYVSKTKIPGLNMRIVIKKVQLLKDTDALKMRSITNEKLASRTMHFGIVPLLALREDTRNMTYYFLSPYFENGDLFEAIKYDNEKLIEGSAAVLNPGKRLRILFHIASAIDFLHTPVTGFRETILHMDIKTLNIVLDKYYNARLIDFGLAREMREGEQAIHTTTRELAHTEGYYRTMKGQKLTKHADYYNFGVVIRELLTGLPFYDEKRREEEQLRHLTDLNILIELMEMWRTEEGPIPVADDLIQLSVKCIKDANLKILSSHYLLLQISRMMNSRNEKRWIERNKSRDKKKDKPRCDMCLVYPAVEDKILSHDSICRCKLNVCVSCMRNSYLNPIRCHSCEAVIKPIIGQGWGAILIAGNDVNQEFAQGFQDDVSAIKNVVTSKCPLVMGIRDSMVRTIYPEKPGTDEFMKNRLKAAISSLNKNEDVQTILIYYSGHYYPKAVEGVNGKGFKLGGEREYLSLEELQSMLSPFLKGSNSSRVLTSRRFIVFLDCCKAPSLLSTATHGIQETDSKQQASASQLTGQSGDPKAQYNSWTIDSPKFLPLLSFEEFDNYSIVQINACRHNQKTVLKSHGSIFRTFLVQALTRKALKQQCRINTTIRNADDTIGDGGDCVDCCLSGDFITMQALQDYITKHFEQCCSETQPVIHAHNVSSHDAKIGYVVNFSADMWFTYTYKNTRKSGRVAQEMFNDILPLKTVLYDRFFDKMVKAGVIQEPIPSKTDFLDILCIEIERGPTKKHREELDTLEKVTGAWNSKRELVVSLREIPELRRGKVGVFLFKTDGCSFTSFLEASAYAKNSKDATGVSFNIAVDKLREFLKTLKNRELQLHMTNVITTIEKAREFHGIEVTELQVIFPVKSDGHSLVRNDFVCFHIKWKECPQQAYMYNVD